MKNLSQANSESNKLNISFIGRSLKSKGMEARKDKDTYYIDLGNDSNLVVNYQCSRISVSIVMPADWESLQEELFFASLTMARTSLIKVFLLPKKDDVNIWFSAESFCKTCKEFEEIFKEMFNYLMKSIGIFLEIREENCKN